MLDYVDEKVMWSEHVIWNLAHNVNCPYHLAQPVFDILIFVWIDQEIMADCLMAGV